MKKHFKLLGAAVIIGVALGSCETDEPIDESEFGDLKIAYNGLIKPTDNSIVLKWNEAVSKVVDNKMPPPPEARIYAMVMLAMHDALNQVIPYYETYALHTRKRVTAYLVLNVIPLEIEMQNLSYCPCGLCMS